MRVVFFGTPDFAVATLNAIYHSDHEIVGVVTTPDKPAGRGLKIHSSEVKEYALEKEIPILQPVKLKDEDFLDFLQKWNADVFVVVAFRMLPKEVYAMPKQGTFNVHASLLPQYRGAAPIHWAIINGETKTGITTFFLNNEIDCGDIILQKEIDILPDETTGELYGRMKILGAQLAIETLNNIQFGNFNHLPQSIERNTVLKPAPKIRKEDTYIEWNRPAKDIINKIRGLSPYPGAVTFLKNNKKDIVTVKIFEATVTPEKSNEKMGIIQTNNKSFLKISSIDFYISITNLQFEGKKRLDIKSFLQGTDINNYTILI